MTEPFDSQPVLNGLKDFQRTTVNYVFERMYGPAAVKRFLVLAATLFGDDVAALAGDHPAALCGAVITPA